MRYGIESRMKPEEAKSWAASFRRTEWRVLKWYERMKDRNKALEALTHRSNDKTSYGRMYEYRAVDADKPPKKRKRAKILYPEY
jgi:hypothetical protein